METQSMDRLHSIPKTNSGLDMMTLLQSQRSQTTFFKTVTEERQFGLLILTISTMFVAKVSIPYCPQSVPSCEEWVKQMLDVADLHLPSLLLRPGQRLQHMMMALPMEDGKIHWRHHRHQHCHHLPQQQQPPLHGQQQQL